MQHDTTEVDQKFLTLYHTLPRCCKYGQNVKDETSCVLRHLRHFLHFQVRLVFALFGGVGAVRFVVDPKTGQRMAYVELKNRENMAKARIHANG